MIKREPLESKAQRAAPEVLLVEVDPLVGGLLEAAGARVVKSGLTELSGLTPNPTLIVTTASWVSSVRGQGKALAGAPLLALCGAGQAAMAYEAGADFVADEGPSERMLRTLLGKAAVLRDAQLRRDAMEAALDLVSDSVEITATTGHILWVNRAFERLTGYKASEAMGHTPAELLRSNTHPKEFYEQIASTVHGGKTWKGSIIGKRKDGRIVEQISTVHPIMDAAGAEARHVAVKQFLPPSVSSQDALGSATSIAALVQSENRYRTMMRAAGDAILICDYDSALIIDVNPAACALFGYTKAEFCGLTGRILGGKAAKDAVSRVSQSLREKGSAYELRHPLQRKDGSGFLADVRMSTYEFMGRRQYMVIIRDATPQVQNEEKLRRSYSKLEEKEAQLFHSSRLAALGQLAAGVAHEINNPLQFISSGLDELGSLAQSRPEVTIAIGDMREGIERIRSATRALLPFARSEPVRSETVDLAEVVRTVVRMTSHELRHRARVQLELEPGVKVLGDGTRLGQVITNLVTNASHASREGGVDANCITVRVRANLGLAELLVADTGTGIPEELRARIFEPFFTTKAKDAGTGLGLALCADIVRTHDGHISVESEVGRGSTFIVTLPLAAAESAPISEVTVVQEAQKKRPARVLLVDDEEFVARAFKRYLTEHTVDIAVGGKMALELLSSRPAYDVVVCDLMMPGMDGPALHDAIKDAHPGLERRMIFCSGGAFTPRAQKFLEESRLVLLEKPLSASALRDAIREVLFATPGKAVAQ